MASNSGPLFGGSLFGGTPGLSNTTAQQPSGISTSNNAPSGLGGGSLFGGNNSLGNTPAQQPSNSAGSNNAPSGTGGSSLFGGSLFGGTPNLTNAASQQPSSLSASNNATGGFGGGAAAITQPPQTSSIFGQSQPAQPSTLGQTQSNPLQLQDQQSETTKPAFFNSLLERGKKRPHSVSRQNGTFEDMPGLQLDLDDIRRKARELGSAANKDSQHKDAATKAYVKSLPLSRSACCVCC